jgi:curved DNA-binding protein CbpA
VDPYEVLGIARTATLDEIHAAYRQLARHFHPDVGGTDPARMAEVNAAWNILRDQPTNAGSEHAFEGPMGHTSGAEASSYRAVLVVMVASAAVLLALVFLAIVLVGFGRVGVQPSP